jgi:sialic acid synthase SpsE
MATLPLKQSAPEGKDIFIIAEIGKNFIQSEEEKSTEEYAENAIALIDAAIESGADAVKFQTHTVEDEQMDLHVVSPHFKGSDRYAWVTRNTKATPEQFWEEVIKHCTQKGITFFTTPMSRGAAQKIAKFDPPFWKVGSGDVLDFVLMEELCNTKRPIIISSGMVSFEELDRIVAFIKEHGSPVILLYCVSKYPCPPEEFNLATIERFKELYPEIPIGFSDHSIGHDATLAAVQLGAQIIEKHFSLSRDLWGSDHKVSMTPKEMKAMVNAIRSGSFATVDTSPFYGEKEKELEGARNVFRPYFQKKLVAAKSLNKGHILDTEDVYALRPASELEGIKSEYVGKVIGKMLAKSLKKYDPITDSDLIS